MILIPAVDILGGKPVQLLRGEFDRATQYGDSPLEAAQRWEAAGACWLHVVDLDGARAGHPVNVDAVTTILRETGLRVQVGGGLRSESHVAEVLDAGAERAVLGTVAVENPDLLQRMCACYPGRIIVALDARNGEVATRGWTQGSGRNLLDVARAVEQAGASHILFTSIEADGGMQGPNLSALEDLMAAVQVPIIASGGVGSVAHLQALERTGVQSVIVGTALYEGKVPISAVRTYGASEDGDE